MIHFNMPQLWPINEKIGKCGLCDAYTYLRMQDNVLGGICEDCRRSVDLTNALLAHPVNHLRPPRQGDMLPESEIL